jgi:hypothetical protein
MVVTLSGHLEAAFSAWIGERFFDLTGSYDLTPPPSPVACLPSAVCGLVAAGR